MTVARRSAETGASGRIASGLAAHVATARRRSGAHPLVWTSLPMTAIDPIDLFAAARSLDMEAVLWLQPATGRAIVGVGRAWAIEVDGPDRFVQAAMAWRALLGDALGSVVASGSPTSGSRTSGPASSGPTLIGGLGFSGSPPASGDPWATFGAASLVLPSFGLVQDDGQSCLTVAVGPDQLDGLDPGRLERRWDALGRHPADPPEGRASSEPHTFHVSDEHPDRVGWDWTVRLFAGAVGRGRLDKVVLARRVVYRANAELDVVEALRRLARSAPESTTFAFAREGMTFMGASPERLIRTVGRSFETVAIAGSVARGRDTDEDARLASALLASEKDREEHAVVVDTLRTSLTPIARSLSVADTPAVLSLRHVQHLVTPISGTLHDDAGLLALAQRLHPTAAVGGAPRDMALALIAEHEGFDRGWYAGPIGWLDAAGDGELMVALRCGLVSGAQATLYAGCGIVADSDPASEWAESRLKLQTMLTALGCVGEADG